MDQFAAIIAKPLCNFFLAVGANDLQAYCIVHSSNVGYFAIGILVLSVITIVRELSF